MCNELVDEDSVRDELVAGHLCDEDVADDVTKGRPVEDDAGTRVDCSGKIALDDDAIVYDESIDDELGTEEGLLVA